MEFTLKYWCAVTSRWVIRNPTTFSVLMGALAGLSFTQHLPLLFILSFLTFLFQIRASKSIYSAFLSGLVYSLTFYLSGLYVLFMLAENYDTSYILSLGIINIFILLYCMTFFIVPAVILRSLVKLPHHMWFLVLMPTLFVMGEWLKTYLFTGFPWFQASHLLVDWLNVEYSLFGELGVSFLFYSFIGCTYLIIKSNNHLASSAMLIASFVGVSILSHLLMGTIIYSGSIKPTNLTVRLLNSQVNIEDKNSLSLSSSRLQQFLNIGSLSPKPDVILLPESSIEYPLEKYPSIIRNQLEKLNNKGIQVVSGGYYQDNIGEYNVLYSGDPLKPVYMKQHLIPFGEYFPESFSFLKHYFPDISKGNLRTKKYFSGNLTIANQIVTPMICYEMFFADEVRAKSINSGILMLFTDLAFIKSNWAKEYLFNISRIRAMELSKPLLQIANSSITAIVNKKGKVLKQAGTSISFIEHDVELSYKPSVYATKGYFYALLLPLFNLIIVSIFSLRSKLSPIITNKRPCYV